MSDTLIIGGGVIGMMMAWQLATGNWQMPVNA